MKRRSGHIGRYASRQQPSRQRRSQVAYARPAQRRAFRQTSLDDLPQRRVDSDRREWRWWATHERIEGFGKRRPRKGQRSAQHFVENDTERPLVRAVVHFRQLERLLGSHVVEGSQEPGAGELAALPVGELHQPEVDHLGLNATVDREKKIVGFEIAVHNAEIVSGGETVRNRKQQLHGVLGHQRAASSQHGRERLAVEELHGQVRVVPGRRAEIEDSHDGGVTEPGQRRRLARQTLGEVLTLAVGAAVLGPEQLQRHRNPEKDVLRAPNRSHGTFADGVGENVFASDELAFTVIPVVEAACLHDVVLYRNCDATRTAAAFAGSSDRGSHRVPT